MVLHSVNVRNCWLFVSSSEVACKQTKVKHFCEYAIVPLKLHSLLAQNALNIVWRTRWGAYSAPRPPSWL